MRKTGSQTSQVANIGQRLRRLRKERKLTQAELACQIGIQQSDLSRMEKGEYRVSLDNLFKILTVFGVKLNEFFADSAQAASRVSRPLAHQDMQVLHMLRQLSDEGRREAHEFIEFKLRREQTERRATENRKSTKASS
jgi:transcriptional regulator with XRE-family HTH domain